MKPKFKIAILGVGAVGGFYGGKLADRYGASDEVEVAFIARGENAQAIQSNGLTLITDEDEQIIHPSIVTDMPEQLGILDLVMCCVKSYSLETSLEPLKPCITEKTIILTVLNGVDSAERIRAMYPQAELWEGCVYITSRLTAPGIVKVSKSSKLLHFGSERGTKEKLEYVNTLLLSAGINANLSGNITQRMWEKFLFISPLATLTSYLDLPIGGIVDNPQYKELLYILLTEAITVAETKKVPLAENSFQKIFDRVIALPPETTSSMHTDFQKGNPTEIQSLTAYVVELGKTLSVPTPVYVSLLKELEKK